MKQSLSDASNKGILSLMIRKVHRYKIASIETARRNLTITLLKKQPDEQ